MGNSISRSNRTPFVSVILDDEFESFRQPTYSIEQAIPTPQEIPIISESEPEMEIEPELEIVSIKPTYSEQLNDQIQGWIYQNLDSYTEQKETLRPFATGAIVVSTLFKLILRTSTIAEVALYGIGMLFLSPFVSNHKENLYNAYEWLSMIPSKTLYTAIIPIELLVITIFMLIIPRSFILHSSEGTKTTFRHIGKGEGCTNSRHCKLYCSNPSARAYRRLLDLQDVAKYSE